MSVTRAFVWAILWAVVLVWLTAPQPKSKHLPRWPLSLYSQVG
jgi:hypothetical protein